MDEDRNADEQKAANKKAGDRKAGVRRLKVAQRKGAWTRKQIGLFFDHLAATCNVAASAAAAKIDTAGAYRRRYRDAEFARLWKQALDEGAERLEALALARALESASLDGIVPDANRAKVDVDLTQALRWIAARDTRSRRTSSEPQIALMPIDEVERVLLRRLAAVEKRLAARSAEKA